MIKPMVQSTVFPRIERHVVIRFCEDPFMSFYSSMSFYLSMFYFLTVSRTSVTFLQWYEAMVMVSIRLLIHFSLIKWIHACLLSVMVSIVYR